ALAERGALWPVEDAVAVVLAARAAARIEVGRRRHAVDDGDVARQQRIEPALKASHRNPAFGREAGHLPERMHAGVGATGAAHGELWLACHLAQLFFERLLDGGRIALALPSAVGGAVVLERQLEGTRHGQTSDFRRRASGFS